MGFNVKVCLKRSERQVGKLDEFSASASSDKAGTSCPVPGSKTTLLHIPEVTGTAADHPVGVKPV
jgi:hypothetical protein